MITLPRRSWVALLSTGCLLAAMAVLAPASEAMPKRYYDKGTILECSGTDPGGTAASLTAIDTISAGVETQAFVLLPDGRAVVSAGQQPVLSDSSLDATLPGTDEETGDPVGDIVISGTISRGDTEVLDGWDVDPDGRRFKTQGTRTPLTGSATMSAAGTTVEVECSGLEIDWVVFVVDTTPPAEHSAGWAQDVHELPDGVGTVFFYGEHRNQLGIGLDVVEPASFAGEQLHVRAGRVEGDLVLRDPDTFEPVGLAHVTGQLTLTGKERSLVRDKDLRVATTAMHYKVDLSVTLPGNVHVEGTYDATFETVMSLEVMPPRHIAPPATVQAGRA
jgi:hypothetical protein